MTRSLKICAAALCAVMLISGCSLVSINEERFNAQVVATVGGEEITVSEYAEMVNLYANYYGISMNDPSMAESASQLKEAALQALVDEKIRIIKARETGVATLSAEDEAAVRNEVDEWVQSQRARIADDSEDELSDEQIQAQLETYMAGLGYPSVQSMYDEQYREHGLNKLFDVMTTDASADDDQVRAYYNTTVEEQKTAFDASPVEYETALNSGVTPLLYMPEGFRHVKHILIKLPDETVSELQALMSSGDESYSSRLAEALEPLNTQAEEVLALALAGQDFDELIAEYGQDPGMTQEPYKTEGYLVCAQSGMIPEFLEASMALNNPGDISGLVGGSFGYHIIKLIDIVPSSTVEYTDELRDELREDVFTQSQRDLYNAKMEEWRAEYEVKRNESLLSELY